MLKQWGMTLILLLAFSVIGFGSAFFGASQKSSPDKNPLTVLPKENSIPGEPVSGEVLKVPLTVYNQSTDETIQLLKMNISCGCMAGTIGDEQLPLDLEPQQSIPIEMSIATRGKIGQQSFTLFIDGVRNGVPIQSEPTSIRANLRSPLIAVPHQLNLSGEVGEPVTAQIVLADSLDESDVVLESVSSSDPQSLTVKASPDDGPVGLHSGVQGTRRFRIDVTYVPQLERDVMHREWVIAEFESPTHEGEPAELRIPVMCQVESSYRLSAKALFVTAASSKETVSRAIVCRFKDPQESLVQVDQQPDNVKVEVEQFQENAWRLLFNITVPESTSGGGEVVLKIGPDEGVIRIPISFVLAEPPTPSGE